MGEVVDRRERDEAEDDVDDDQEPDLAEDRPSPPVEHRHVHPRRDEQDPEQAEDRARRADGERVPSPNANVATDPPAAATRYKTSILTGP